MNKKTSYLIWTMIGLVVIAIGAYATVTTTNIFSTNIENTGNISSGKVNVTSTFITKDPYVDVRAFGAVAGDNLDDSTAIQAAVDSLSNGGIIYIPSGDYLITNTIKLKNKTQIECEQDAYLLLNDSNVLKCDDVGGQCNSGVFLMNQTWYNRVSGCEINGSGFSKTPPADPEDGNAGVICYKCHHSEIDHNYIYDMGTNNTAFRGYGVLLIMANMSHVHHNDLRRNGYEGIGIRQNSNNIIIDSNFALDNYYHCIQVGYMGDLASSYLPSKDVSITNNVCGYGYESKSENNKIIVHFGENVIINSNHAGKIRILGNVSEVVISNNILRGLYKDSGSYGIQFETATGNLPELMENVIITGNVIRGYNKGIAGYHRGIELVCHNSGSEIKNIDISNNYIEHKTTGIYLDAQCGNNLINHISINANIIKNLEEDGQAIAFWNNISGNILVNGNIFYKDLYLFSSDKGGNFTTNVSVIGNDIKDIGSFSNRLNDSNKFRIIGNQGWDPYALYARSSDGKNKCCRVAVNNTYQCFNETCP